MQPASDRIDDESKRHLQEVKKGKPRKFLMLKDGVQIDRLIVFKTGSFDRVLRNARQDGVRGDAFWGMLRGDGTDIRFELSRADGFVSPPGTDLRLKEFLKEATSMKFEPTYVIVDNLAPIEGADLDDTSAQAPDDETVGEQEASSAEDAATRFARLLHLLLPHVNRALPQELSVNNELRACIRNAQELGLKHEFALGLVALRQVGETLKQAIAEMASAASSAETDSAADQPLTTEQARRREWDYRLAQIQPRYSQAVRGAGTGVEQLQMVMDYAQNEARRQQYVKALVGLDRLEKLLEDV